MRGTRQKDIVNKQMLSVYKQLVLEVQRFFPELVQKIYVLNAPLFFDSIWEEELSVSVDKET